MWDRLAQSNYKFYIYTDKGRDVSDEDFIKSGKEDYQRFILDDPLLTARASVLEIGCGAGRILQHMKDFKRVVGTDVSGEMIKQASTLKGVELYETNGESLPVEDNSMDLIFSYTVFQHIKNYVLVERYFKEVARVLKPYGVFKVLLRGEKQKSLKPWWSGVHFKGFMIDHLCKKNKLTCLKKEETKDGRI